MTVDPPPRQHRQDPRDPLAGRHARRRRHAELFDEAVGIGAMGAAAA